MSISTISNASSSAALLRLLQESQRNTQSPQSSGQSLPTSGQTQPSTAQMTRTGGAQLASNALSTLFGMQSSEGAERPKGPPPGGQPPSAADMAGKMMSELDADGDGKLSADEIKSALTAAGASADTAEALSKMDSNGDGAISTDELTTAFEAVRPKDGQGRQPRQVNGEDAASAIVSAFNTDNQDGLSLSEIASALGADKADEKTTKKFDALDANKDGVLSGAELAAGLKAQFAEATSAYSQAQSLAA